jgi:hypothetical protein
LWDNSVMATVLMAMLTACCGVGAIFMSTAQSCMWCEWLKGGVFSRARVIELSENPSFLSACAINYFWSELKCINISLIESTHSRSLQRWWVATFRPVPGKLSLGCFALMPASLAYPPVYMTTFVFHIKIHITNASTKITDSKRTFIQLAVMMQVSMLPQHAD